MIILDRITQMVDDLLQRFYVRCRPHIAEQQRLGCQIQYLAQGIAHDLQLGFCLVREAQLLLVHFSGGGGNADGMIRDTFNIT